VFGGARPPVSVQGRRPKLETQRAESGGSVLEEREASPLPTSYGVSGSAVSSPSGVWGRTCGFLAF